VDSQTLESTLIQHEENSMIHALIEERLLLFREILLLRDAENMCDREIAGAAGAPAGTAALHPIRANAMIAATRNGSLMNRSKEMLP
jgi:DNA-directed RNA polymerase specialized sigma24 family protein